MMPQIKPYTGEQAVAQMDTSQLESIVSNSLAEPVTICDWQVTSLGGLDSSPMAGGVYRLEGTAVTRTHKTRNWCVVVKILCSPAGLIMPDGTHITPEMAEDQSHFGYW
ncbi:MAG: hypothetical protein HC804_14215, partial [Anaerolineae bacterium]|nr:hypothetical protein [Anaerolineae bacterium]